MTANELEILWNTRDRLVEELTSRGLMPDRTLYIRREDGGVFALAVRKDSPRVLSFDWDGACCRYGALEQPSLSLAAYDVQPGGFGGMFGVGEKGAHGWMLRVLDGEALVWQAPVLPGMTAIADLLYKEDRFLNGRRKRATVPHWQLTPEDGERCGEIFAVWQKILGNMKSGEQ